MTNKLEDIKKLTTLLKSYELLKNYINNSNSELGYYAPLQDLIFSEILELRNKYKN